jgi:sugar phosphate isomerase/epimerase
MVRLVDRRRFGVSTRIFRAQPLTRPDLVAIAAHGFDMIELVAVRAALDFTSPAAVADFQQRLGGAGLTLSSVHVPLHENADEVVLLARRIPVPVLIVQATTPRETAKAMVQLHGVAAPLGVRLAIDSASMAPIGSLVHFVEQGVDVEVGVCLDFARAHRDASLVDSIEAVAEYLVAARLPIDSAIDWPSAMTTAQKVGYEGPFVFDADPRGSTAELLARAKVSREKIERWLTST